MARTRAGIVLLARMASSRLPGKAMASIGSRVILGHCVARMIASGVGRVVLATTTRPEDDVLAEIARRMGALVTRGDADDVLGRTAQAVNEFDLDPVVRATADNPAVDIQAPGRLLAALRELRADYVREEGLPYGGGVEAMTAAALQYAAANATEAYDREHVTPFLRRRTDLFRSIAVPAPAPLHRPSLSLTVDTAEDLAWVRELFARVGKENPSLRALIAAAGRSTLQHEVA
jgi:spore coat polysaccharide biosynthesis protein SpsF (cytidylyltransferase family)